MSLLHDLRALSAGFGRLATTPEAAARLVSTAANLAECAGPAVHGYSGTQLQRWATVHIACLCPLFGLAFPDTRSPNVCVCSELATLAQRLASIAPALAAAAAVAADACASPAWLQVSAACISAAGCGSVSTKLRLQGSAALLIAAAAQVVLVAGRTALVTSTERVRQQAPAAPAAAQVQATALLQLTAMTSFLTLMDLVEQPNVKAAFANSTAAPQAFLPWLSAVGDALLLCPAPLPGVAEQK
jgi:hypothetical protein